MSRTKKANLAPDCVHGGGGRWIWRRGGGQGGGDRGLWRGGGLKRGGGWREGRGRSGMRRGWGGGSVQHSRKLGSGERRAWPLSGGRGGASVVDVGDLFWLCERRSRVKASVVACVVRLLCVGRGPWCVASANPLGGGASGKPFGSAVVVVVVVIGVVLVVVGYVVGTRELRGERGKGRGSVERGVPPPRETNVLHVVIIRCSVV